MTELCVKKNIVLLSKSQDYWDLFVREFLVKFEDVMTVDIYKSTRTKKKFKTVKERRNLYTEDQDYVYFSRGLLSMIPPSAYTIKEQDEENSIITPNLTMEEITKTLSSFDLRQDQTIAVRKCLMARRGVIQLPTAVGKSAIITATIKRLQEVNPSMKSLVLAPTLSTVKNINDTIAGAGIETSVFGHPSKDIKTPVTTALVQSLISKSKDDPHFLDQIDAVFYDECLPANAKILLPDYGEISISDLYERDDINEVLSFNFSKGQYEVKRILRKFKTPYEDRFWKVYYTHPLTGRREGVTLTPNHKVFTVQNGYVQAQELNQDHIIQIDHVLSRCSDGAIGGSKSGYVKVDRVVKNVGKVAAFKYNIEVEDNHNYFANHVLVSNCHHLKCDTWSRLNTLLPNVEYSLGFSALSIDKSEIDKTDIRDLSYDASLIVGCSGRVLMHMDPSYYIDKGIIALPVIMRVKHVVKLPQGLEESNWSSLVKFGLMSTVRTDKVANVASVFSRHHRKVLVLVSERDYSFSIGRFLLQRGCSKFGISFGAGEGYVYDSHGTIENNEVTYSSVPSLDVVDMLSTGEIDVLIATSHLDEGADIKSLDACILACGGKKDRRIIQRVGRVLRKSKSGKYAYVVDFTDEGSRVLSRQSKTRLSMYVEDIGVPKENVFDDIPADFVENKLKELEGLS